MQRHRGVGAWCVAGLVVGASLAGCSSAASVADPEPAVSATPAVADPSPTPSGAPADPYAVPDEITPEYVERVYDALAAVEAEAIRRLMRAYEDNPELDTLPADVAELLAAIYAKDEFLTQVSIWEQLLTNDEPFEGARSVEDFGQARLRDVKLRVTRRDCIVGNGHVSLAETAVSADPDLRSWVAFVLRSDAAARGSNETPWLLARERPAVGPNAAGFAEADVCA